MARPRKYKTLAQQREAHRLRVARWRLAHPQAWRAIQERAYARRKGRGAGEAVQPEEASA